MTNFQNGLRLTLMATIAASTLSGCLGSGSNAGGGAAAAAGAPVVAPVNNLVGEGRLIAVALPGTTQADGTGGVTRNRTSSSAVSATARTAAGGITYDVTADDDPASTDNSRVLLTSTSGQLADATTVPGFTNEPAQLQLQFGRFGDPQTRTTNTAAGTNYIGISGVSIYNLSATQTIDLDDVMTVRYDSGVNGTGTQNIYGVGFYGTPTPAANVPANATYTAFLEPSETDIYLDFNSTATITIAPGTFDVAVTGGLNGLGGPTPNANVAGLRASGTLVGSNVTAGSARMVDAGGATVGTVEYSDLIGGIFGATGGEAAAAVIIEGTMDLNGNANSDYFFSAVFGGKRN